MRFDSIKVIFLGVTVAVFTILICGTASAITNEGVKKLADVQNDNSPNYSPDGNKIVFSSLDYNTDPNQASIWIMNLTTGDRSKVNIPDSKCLYYVDWHPSGNKIIFRDGDRNIHYSGEIYTINIDGTAKTCLTTDQNNEVGDAHYSPSGEKIVYTVQYSDYVLDIWLMDADGNNKTRLTNNDLNNGNARFNPDGTKIVYSSGVGSNTKIWIMNSNGGNKKQLTFGSGMEGAPVMSPDGQYIAYQKSPGLDQPWNIWVMKADGSGQTQLTDYSIDGIDGATPDWSPDGKKLVFCSGGMHNNWDIYEMTLNLGITAANFSSNVTSGAAPLSVQFTDLSKNAASLSWNFGDGSTSTQQNPTHTYTKTGQFNVVLTAKNTTGSNTLTRSKYISVQSSSEAPVTNFSASPTSGKLPLTVSFTDKSTGSPTSFKWTFGDGGTSTQQNPVYTYNKVGLYPVTLSTGNAGGNCSLTKTNYIAVENGLDAPVTAFSAIPRMGKVPLSVSFADRSKGSITSWKWLFGNGGTSVVQNPSYTYTNAGKYTVTLTTSNAAGSNALSINSYINATN